MSDQDVDAFLEHYGVKGMQWGVRNERSKEQIQRRDRRIKTVKKLLRLLVLRLLQQVVFMLINYLKNMAQINDLVLKR